MIHFESNEKIIAIFRKHWIDLLGEGFGLVTIAAIPLLLFGIFYSSFFSFLPSNHITLLAFFYILFLMLVWVFGFILWVNYYLDMWILTDKRLVHIEQHHLFSREISSLHLDNIQDVTIQVHGLIQTLLKVGEIHVQTAAMQKEFVIRNATHPQKVKHLIMRAHTTLLDRVKTVRIHQD